MKNDVYFLASFRERERVNKREKKTVITTENESL